MVKKKGKNHKKEHKDIWRITQTDVRYVKSLLILIGVVFFWRGIWDTIYLIPILDNPFVSIFVGLTIITLTGAIFRQV